MAGTRSGGKKYKFKTSGSAKQSKSQKRLKQNSDDEVQEQLSTLVFDDYWSLIWKRIPSERIEGCVYYHPLSFRSNLPEKSVKKLKKWVSRQKVFSSRYVFIPMCQSNHWNMLIICNIGEDMNSETNSPCMFLLDSLQIGEATRLEPRLREFVFHLYESGNRKESAEEIFNIPYNIPSIPQQEDGTKCGYYMLFYMFKFLTACPYQFDISKDYPGFMTEDWFDKDEFQKFYEDLTSEKDKECSLSDTTTDKKKDGEGSSIQKIENVNNDMLQTTPSHDLFRSNDALPPLVSYTPESSQEEQKITQCNKPSPLPAIEESKIEGDVVKKKKSIKFKIKSGEQRKSPRLIEAKKNPNDYTKDETKVAAEEDERNSTEEEAEPVVISVVDHNEDEENLDSNNEDKADEDDFIEDGKSKKTTKPKKKKRKASSPVKMKRAKKRKNVKEEEEETEEEEPTENRRKPETDMPNKILLRAYPKTFTDAIQALTEDQKKWVTEAGFGPLLSFAMRKVPHSMCVNIIWWYDLTEDEMIFSKQRVKITEQDVGPLHISNTGERQSTRNVSAEEHRQQDVNHENEEAAILKLRKNKGKLPAEEFVDIFQEGENFKTPKETLSGVEMIPQVFKEDETYSGIMSVARDIKYTYEDNEIITEEEMMTQVDKDIKELEFVYEKCKNNLKLANDLFPNNHNLKLIEPESDRDPEWPYYTNKDWKTIDILALPKYDRAYNKMIDIDDFLGDLTLGGERIDFDRFEREGDTEYNPGRLRREVKVGDSKKSPFLDRTIDFNKQKITKAEEEVWNWITADTSDATQIIFFWEDVICMSYQIKTFQFNEKISTAVIDVYATILNEDEKYRSPDSPHRFFCNTNITGVQQKKQLEKARQIYASKIIYSPINLYKNKMVNEIKSLCQPR
uniref:Ubiquitin-like protease family profile domain-containing protein n=1 Tax=Daucus carota subsp. sativus TaxID=79200 RepID=A0A164Y9F0_DAUCS